jgi:hypothetical protein
VRSGRRSMHQTVYGHYCQVLPVCTHRRWSRSACETRQPNSTKKEAKWVRHSPIPPLSIVTPSKQAQNRNRAHAWSQAPPRSRPLPALQSWDGDLGGLTCRDQPPHPNTLTSRSSREGLSEQNPRSRNPSHAHHKKRHFPKIIKIRMTHPNIRFISWSSSFAHFPHHHVWIRGVQRRLVPWGGDWSSGRDWRVHLHPSAY